MYIPCKVQNTNTNAVVDTAAQITVMSFDFYNKLHKKPLLKDYIKLKGAGKENEIKARLAKNVSLQIGGITRKWDIVVGEIADSLLLGLDFLKTYESVIDLRNYTVTIDRDVIQAVQVKTEEHKEVKIYQVFVKARTVIPPESVKFVPLQTDRPFKGELCIETASLAHLHGLMPPNSVINENQTFIGFRNPTNKYITVKKGQKVGQGLEVEEVTDLEENASFMVNKIEVAEGDSNSQNQHNTLLPHMNKLFEKSIEQLDQTQAEEVSSLLNRFQHVFSKDDFDLGLFNGDIKHKIDTENSQPIRQKLRRTPMGFEKEEEKHLQQMLEKGIIQPSTSDWASPPVLIRKKDGKLRFCIDFRALNKVTIKDAFPIPNIQVCIDTLGDNTFFSSLDMASGYWQVLMDEQDRHKTAFITKYGLFEHVRLPFGLCNSPATFSRIIQTVLRGLTWKECLAYLDDVVVLGKDFDEHLQNLSLIFSRFEQYNLKLKPEKCVLFQTEIKFLGKMVSQKGVSINPESIEAVKTWPIPKNTKQLESFLGFANYHRDHVKKFSEMSSTLYDLVKTSKKTKFIWTSNHDTAFNEIKNAIIQAATLSYPNSEDLFILDTDASDKCVGAELIQIQNGKEKIISFASKVLTPTQRKYCTTRKELLAIVVFTRQFRHFLLGKNFIVRTDHNSLTWLLSFKNIEGQLARWLEELSQYNMTIQHRMGTKHMNVDPLSRIPDELDPCGNYTAGVNISQLPCGGCRFCTRAHNQWQSFEDDVDYVIPLTVRQISTADQTIVTHLFATGDLQKAQSGDSDLSKLTGWLQNDHCPSQFELSLSSPAVKYFWSNKSQLVFFDGILYYKWEDPINPRHLLLAPKELQSKIMKYCHDHHAAGHLGQSKTYDKVKNCAIWHGMSQDIKLYVQSCATCNKNKKASVKPKAALGQYHAGSPMQRVHMDILGPLPITKRGNKYILMVIDQFTKWLECLPLPNQNAETVARSLVDGLFSKLGCPIELHTDQGKNMDGQMIRQLCQMLEISKTRTTPYHPSSNGQVERYNRLVLQSIRCYIKNKQNNWDMHLQQIAGAIRATQNRQTGCTPNLLMLGREVMQPVDIMLGTAQINNPEKETNEYLASLMSKMSEAHQLARENIGEAQVRQKKDYDHKIQQKTYNVGDVVLKLDSATKVGQSSKLKSPWKGPYIISKILSPVLYQIIDKKNKETVVHHDRLKLCRDREHPVWLKRARNKYIDQDIQVCTNLEKTSYDQSEEQVFDLSGLFSSDTDDVHDDSLSDILIPNPSSAMTTASDTLMQNTAEMDDSGMSGVAPVSKSNAPSKRRRKMPGYLKDYIQD